MYTKVFFTALIVIGLSLYSCQTETKEEPVKEEVVQKVEEKKEIPSVCIWDEASLRAQPSRKAKWLSAMALGEKVTWLGKTVIDSSNKNREYLYIRLSDGTEGWASAYVIAKEARPSVAAKKAAIYRRPDLLTATNKEFLPMEVAAILKSENDWIEVVGKENKKKGWIQSNLVSISDEDIAVALLAAKALAEKDSEKQIEKLKDIVNNTAFANSMFLETLREKLNELNPENETDDVEEESEEML